ncbi:MAG: ribbon-helix-helix protein, CopG family [Candidatus Dadabacteria bacterium]|nr:ribbon-helix-helix protein, CopG family [Candidatus Dadabacteria bacterium]
MPTNYVSVKPNRKGKLKENGRFEVTIPLTLISKLDKFCAKSDIKRSEAVEEIIEQYLKKLEQRKRSGYAAISSQRKRH